MSTLTVFIHGALSSAKSWNFLRAEVENSCTFEYDITSTAAVRIVDDIYPELLKKVGGYSSVTFVGHSFGGIISIELARKLLSDPGRPVSAADLQVLTLGTPLGGSGIASVLRVFRPSSWFYRNVGAYDTFMAGFKNKLLPCRTYSIITTTPDAGADFLSGENDGVVTVESQEYFNGDRLHSHKYLYCNHFEVLLMPEIRDLVREASRSGDLENKFQQMSFSTS